MNKNYLLDKRRNASGYVLRFLYLLRMANGSKNRLVRMFCKVLLHYYRVQYGFEISSSTQIGGGLYMGHAYNITINPKAVIGANCNIHKGVTIGQENRGKRKGVPTIGNRVWMGVNSTIVGGIEIGEDVLIAPNSYVNCDVPSHSIVFGNPCIIKHRDNATEGYINNVCEE